VGVAGPVLGEKVSLTNTVWTGSVDDLPCRGVIINDLEAAAYGVRDMSTADHLRICGDPLGDPTAPILIIGVGTGFGCAVIVGDRVVPTEAGHAALAACSSRTGRVIQMFSKDDGRTTVESVLSGRGLRRLARATQGESISVWPEEQEGTGPGTQDEWDGPLHRESIPPQAMDVFIELLASHCSDLVLNTLALGGVFLVGGICQLLSEPLSDGRFQRTFSRDTPMSGLLSQVPCYVVTHPDVGLLGAGAYVSRKIAPTGR